MIGPTTPSAHSRRHPHQPRRRLQHQRRHRLDHLDHARLEQHGGGVDRVRPRHPLVGRGLHDDEAGVGLGMRGRAAPGRPTAAPTRAARTGTAAAASRLRAPASAPSRASSSPGTSSTPPTMIRLGSPSAWASTQWMTLAVRIHATLPANACRERSRSSRVPGRGSAARPRAGSPPRARAVIAADLDLEARARDLRGTCRTPRRVKADVTRREDVEALVATHDRIDVYFNNAGIPERVKPLAEITREEWDAVARRQPDGAVRRRPGRRAEAAPGRRAARHRLDHRQPATARPRRLRRVQGRRRRARQGAGGRARPRRPRERDQPRPGQHADARRASASTPTPRRRSRSSA